MCVALIGGMERLRRRYVDLKVHDTAPNRMSDRRTRIDGSVVLTNRVSHEAKRGAVTAAKAGEIPVLHFHPWGDMFGAGVLGLTEGSGPAPAGAI